MKRIIIWSTIILLNIANRNCEVFTTLSGLKDWYRDIKQIYELPYTVKLLDYTSPEVFQSKEPVKSLIKRSIKKITCYLTYYMVLYMHVRHPENYVDGDNINDSIEDSCPTLAQQMLVTRINTDHFKENNFSRIVWIFYLHTCKMKQLASMPDSENINSQMKILYDNGLKFVQGEMPERCAIDDYSIREDKGIILKNLLISDRSLALNKLTGLCERQKIGEHKIKQVHFDRLCLNNVIENKEKMDTLTTSFGHLKNSDQIVDVLSTLMKLVKNPMTSLCVMINSLKSVHVHFIQMLKTIMLRLFQTFVSQIDVISSIETCTQILSRIDEFREILSNKPPGRI